MELLGDFISIILHLDQHLGALVDDYGLWIYAILFLIVFSETGLVVCPFLPGDSLLFVAGGLAAMGQGGMDITTLIIVLFLAALLGNTVNYFIGRLLGPKVFSFPNSKLFNKKALEKTHFFYEKHGGKTLIISRFLPLFRTFAPFVAGVAKMSFVRFCAFNATGAFLWVMSLCLAGFWLFDIPFVKKNLSVFIIAIIVISLVPMLIAFVNSKRAKRT